jgi:hypothetical protein
MKFEWEHIFPNGEKRTTIVTVGNEKVISIVYNDGKLLERTDFQDVLESLEQNADMVGGYANL